MALRATDGAGNIVRLYTPAEVAIRLRVDSRTVTRWAQAGKLDAIRTPGGHRRYDADDIDAMLHGAKRRGGK